jgi:prolyl-tRNA editing enzyme YbaK/EbsC (Cys-tRNA(Pro) deacylase)
MTWTVTGFLTVQPAVEHPELLAEPVARALAALPEPGDVGVVEIDPKVADTAAFCATYGSPLTASADCVVVSGKRAGEERFAACLILATTRVDVTGVVRERLDVRAVSFAPAKTAVELTGMAYGGFTPLGLPLEWPLLIDPAIVAAPELIIGSGTRHSKVLIAGAALAALPNAEVVEGLGRQSDSLPLTGSKFYLGT